MRSLIALEFALSLFWMNSATTASAYITGSVEEYGLEVHGPPMSGLLAPSVRLLYKSFSFVPLHTGRQLIPEYVVLKEE